MKTLQHSSCIAAAKSLIAKDIPLEDILLEIKQKVVYEPCLTNRDFFRIILDAKLADLQRRMILDLRLDVNGEDLLPFVERVVKDISYPYAICYDYGESRLLSVKPEPYDVELIFREDENIIIYPFLIYGVVPNSRSVGYVGDYRFTLMASSYQTNHKVLGKGTSLFILPNKDIVDPAEKVYIEEDIEEDMQNTIVKHLARCVDRDSMMFKSGFKEMYDADGHFVGRDMEGALDIALLTGILLDAMDPIDIYQDYEEDENGPRFAIAMFDLDFEGPEGRTVLDFSLFAVRF